jgi:hypothetical protein
MRSYRRSLRGGSGDPRIARTGQSPARQHRVESKTGPVSTTLTGPVSFTIQPKPPYAAFSLSPALAPPAFAARISLRRRAIVKACARFLFVSL